MLVWVSFTLVFAVLSLQGVGFVFIVTQYCICLVITEQIWAGHCCCCLAHCKNALLSHYESIINPSVVHQKGWSHVKVCFLTYKWIMLFLGPSNFAFSCTDIMCVTPRNVIWCRVTCLPDKQVYLMMFLLEVDRCWMIQKLPMECSVLIVSLKASR